MGRPTSTGCLTCRRRRVKCDEKYPLCKRCEIRGEHCEGYAREYRFMVYTPQQTCASGNTVIRSSIPDSLGLSSFEDNIHTSFLLSKLDFQPHSFSKVSPWIRVHAESLRSAAAQHCIRALSALYFGRIHHQAHVLNRSIVNYGKALKHLNELLRDPDQCFSIPALSCASVLQVYELMASSSEGGWLKHAGGAGKLVELRGPSGYQTQAELGLFEYNRAAIVFEHWTKGERCFLEQPGWKTLPWARDPASKTAFSNLQDIFCDIPGLVEDLTRLKSDELGPSQRESLCQTFLKNVLDRLKELYEWRNKWEEDNPDSCFQVPAPQHADEDPLFPTTLQFSSLSSAFELLIYGAVLLVLLGFGYEVGGPAFDPRLLGFPVPCNAPRSPLHLPGEAQHPRDVAVEMCMIMEYCLSAHPTSVGLWLTCHMKYVKMTFPPTSREAKWLEEKTEQASRDVYDHGILPLSPPDFCWSMVDVSYKNLDK